MTEQVARIHFIDKERRRIELSMNGVLSIYPLNTIPDDLYEIMVAAVDGHDTPEEQLEAFYQGTAMKPILCTNNNATPFPVNASAKLIRLVPTDDVLEEKAQYLQEQVLALQGIPFEETLEERFSIYRNLYIDDKKINHLCFGIAEMYGDTTYRNIQRDPRVSLVTYWPSPDYMEVVSYQINGIAEVIPKGTPFYTFMQLSRTLFTQKFISLRGPNYISAYRIWISEILEKTLASKTGYVPES